MLDRWRKSGIWGNISSWLRVSCGKRSRRRVDCGSDNGSFGSESRRRPIRNVASGRRKSWSIIGSRLINL